MAQSIHEPELTKNGTLTEFEAIVFEAELRNLFVLLGLVDYDLVIVLRENVQISIPQSYGIKTKMLSESYHDLLITRQPTQSIQSSGRYECMTRFPSAF